MIEWEDRSIVMTRLRGWNEEFIDHRCNYGGLRNSGVCCYFVKSSQKMSITMYVPSPAPHDQDCVLCRGENAGSVDKLALHSFVWCRSVGDEQRCLIATGEEVGVERP